MAPSKTDMYKLKNRKVILFRQGQNTAYRKTKPNSLLKTKIKTCDSSLFSETQKSKPSPSPKSKSKT